MDRESYQEISDLKVTFKDMKKVAGWSALAVVILYLLSGIYIVESNELGVVTRFGRIISDNVPPGIHYHLPYPIERVDKPKVKEIKRISLEYIGISIDDDKRQFLTGDENIINLGLMIQYMIKSPADFLFAALDPHSLVRKAAEAALTQTIATRSIDEILTTEKLSIQERVKKDVQQALDRDYGCGIQILAVHLQEVAPPSQAEWAFKDVASAREDRNRIINEAQGYRNDIIPEARGQAQKLLSEAGAYQEERVNYARGEADRFLHQLAEYRNAKDVTATRLYIEAMEEILPRIKKVIVDEKEADAFNLKFIGGMDEKQ
ncbi:MAG: FtsH protease activity modulator HflK [bacterium]|nr:FtsH protease activity modulator HflK [bacterium]